MTVIVYLGLDVLFLLATLYIIKTENSMTNLSKSFLAIPASLLLGDLLVGLGLAKESVEMGYTVVWVFAMIIVSYFYSLEEGKPKKDILNLGGVALFSPVLFLFGGLQLSLIVCYGVALFIFSTFFHDKRIEMKSSGVLGMLACIIFIIMSISQFIWGMDPGNSLLLPRVILLSSLSLFGYMNLAPFQKARICMDDKKTINLRKSVPTVLRLKEERRAILSESKAMENELKRIKDDKSKASIDGVYGDLKKKYAKEVSMLTKAASKNLNKIRVIEKELKRIVKRDKADILGLSKELEEAESAMKRVREIMSNRPETPKTVVKKKIVKKKEVKKTVGKRRKG